MDELIADAARRYADAHTTDVAGPLAQVAAWTQEHTPSPGMMSGLAEARLLQALIAVSSARTVLEIGTFTAFGTLAMAQALGPGGRVTTLEVDEDIAVVARRHIEAGSLSDRITLIVGDAKQTLEEIDGPFDLVYIDAAKTDYPDLWQAVVPKLGDRGAVVADNLFRAGRVLDPSVDDEPTRAMRRFADDVQADPRVDNVLLTVGDGLMLAWRRLRPA